MSTDPSTPENDPNLSALGRELLGTNEGSKPSGPWVPPTAEELHKLLPEYEIVKMLGRGGMGAVYMGKQISLDRPVAIKILSNALEEADASFAERFKNEAKAMGKLSHPGIVAVHDFGETEGGLLYIVMEYVEGTDVAKMIAKSGRLHTEHAMAITAHVCDALGYAHERGIIHRDIKPANIMVGYDGVVKVADFGLAKMTHSQNTGLTQSGMAMGTLHYMAPEALMLGSAVDHRADIYAVGVMLYQMLTGKIPQGMFKLPSLQIPGLDPRYDGIIAKAIMEDREARYQTVRELRGDLDAILTQPVIKVEESAEAAPAVLPTQARPQRPGARQSQRPPQSSAPPPPKARSSGAWLVPAVLAVLALGGGWWWLDREGPSSNNLPPVPEPVGVAEAEPTANSPAKTTSAMPVASAPAPAVMETTKETATDSTPAFFDGKTLSGWTTHGTAVWRVEQGGITSDSGSGMGTISRSLSSPWFDLTGDVYASADGNGGIHFQITDLVTFKDGLEVQICGSKARGRAVGAGGLFAPKLGKAGQRNGKQALLPDAQFTPFRLVVEEGSIRFWLAGEQVFEAKHTLRPEIRTLAFSRLGPEGKVAYRNLRLTLPGEKATKPPTTDNTGKSSRIDGLVANGEWQDVLKIIGGKSAINVGTWSYDNHVLKCTKSSWNASISVPSEALASYSARLRFASSDFRNLTVILPIPKGRMTFAVDVFRNRVGWLTQPGPSAESWPLKQKVADGKEHELLVEVSPGRLLAKIDGTLAYDQANPDWDAIKPLVGYPPGSTVALGVGAHQAVVEFRSFEILIPLAAVGKNTPAPDPQLSPNLQLRPEVATRVANYQKARHAQLTDLTAKYRAALSSEKDAAIKSGVLADATAANGALAAADAFSKVVEASLTSSDVAPLPALAAVADPAPQRLKELRDIFVREVAKIESTLIAGLDQSLATVQASLVQAGKTAEAGSVEKYRTQMMAAFKTGAPTAVAPTPSSVTTTNPAEATKDRPFVNALGMKFVPVPGTKVLMCIHETRRRDFAAFDDARPTGNSEWRIPFPLEGESRETDQHPVIKVSWLESVAFADWLTEREGVRYRLPTDDEWSKAVGGDEFPWGNQWPPTSAIGNYADDSTIGRIKGDYGSIPGYTDGFILTAPVMSFPANNLGIHDLGGNVWEWCETPSPQKPTEKILRGAAWNRGWRNHLASSMRTEQPPGDRFNVYGFRVVIELPATAAQPTSSVSVPAPKPVTSSPTLPVSSSPSTATKDKPFVNSLGMKFVPIRITGGPTDGKTLLFSVWETRVKDFAEFAKANSVSDAAWQNLSAGGVTQTGDHPVVNVSWDDAVRFCKWLSKKENVVCRLPSDHEWSCAAGIGATEDPRLSPAAKSPRGVGAYPWGTAKNPPNDFANYKGMNDGFAFTAPVGSFSATADGLHDLWGNAGEWCDDWHDPAIRAQRVIRGHSWENFGPPRTVNWRLTMPRDGDASMVGFRVVIELP